MSDRSACMSVVAVLAGASLATAATLSVGPTQTYQTVQSALNAAHSGDVILVDPGTYVGRDGTMAIDGLSNITIKGNGGMAVLDMGPDHSVSVWGKGECMISGNSSNITLENLEFLNAAAREIAPWNDTGYNGAGVYFGGKGLLHLKNCVIHDCEMGIRIDCNGADVLVENSVIHDCGGPLDPAKTMIWASLSAGRLNSFTLVGSWVYNGLGHDIQVSADVIKILYNRLGDEVIGFTTDPDTGAPVPTWGGGGGQILQLATGGLTYVIGNQFTRGSAGVGTLNVYGGSIYSSYSSQSLLDEQHVHARAPTGASTAISIGSGSMLPYVANNAFIHWNGVDTDVSGGANPFVWETNYSYYWNLNQDPDGVDVGMLNFNPLPDVPWIDCHLRPADPDNGIDPAPEIGMGMTPETLGDTSHPELGTFSLAAVKQLVLPSSTSMPTLENRSSCADAGMYEFANDPSVNEAPTVTAGTSAAPTGASYPNRAVVQNAGLLMGAASDDGLPSGVLTTTWSQVSGPGTASFLDANSPITTATFTAPGVYELKLTASDGTLSSESTVKVWAEMPPTVDAGVDQTIALDGTLNLSGSVSDDGLPSGSTVTTTWSVVSVPSGAVAGDVTFAAANNVATSATGFTVNGVYVLRLAGTDSVFSSSDTVSITVGTPNNPPVVDSVTGPAFVYEGWAGSLTNLVCTAHDPDGDSVDSYTWTQTAGKNVGPISGGATATFTVPSLTLASDAVLTFQVTATDSKGGVSAPGSVTVNAYLKGDITHDGIVNVGDLQALALAWSTQGNGLAADLNGDTYVNVGDLQALVSNWNRQLN